MLYIILKYFNNFADYNGYTKIQVYLPFFGFIDVNPNDVIGKVIKIGANITSATRNIERWVVE